MVIILTDHALQAVFMRDNPKDKLVEMLLVADMPELKLINEFIAAITCVKKRLIQHEINIDPLIVKEKVLTKNENLRKWCAFLNLCDKGCQRSIH